MTRIHDLLDLPESIRKSDYVQGLAAGIQDAERTVSTYAITPSLVTTYGHALSVIKSALETGRSQAVWLHGSFGSGKSHFMAILDLMIAGHAAPWKRGEFHALRETNPWLGGKNVLQLPLHMLDKTGLEDAIFAAYVEHVRKEHPDAPLPALFGDQALFGNARSMRTRIGDDAFFGALNEGKQAADDWGDLGDAGAWDSARFERTIDGEDEAERRALFSDLVKTLLPVVATLTDRFVPIDRGLAELSRHAASLGYDTVLLYLDEVVLWLRGRISDLPFVEREIQKLVKLTEAQDERRDVPIVSFLARQRDVAKWLAEGMTGDDRVAVEELLEHNSGRFEPIVLADSNLPAIVNHRVVKPRDDSSKEALEDGFSKLWRSAADARGTLVGSDGDEAAFRQVFPFSPALVEVLVALSDCLQRERTAIRILMELLVEHLPDLELGTLVPVGDAFDVIAGGEDPMDGLLQARWQRARALYQQEFLPLIQGQHENTTAETCQRLRPGFPSKLGCSKCPKTACRNDNRLAKTLLMAALVPEAKPFKGLTAKRLVHLNHGAIATFIPGNEVNIVAERLRDWAAQIGPLRIGDQADPEISLHLEGVDLKPILDSAREYDGTGPRKQRLRELVFEALGFEGSGSGSTAERTPRYLGVKRKGQVRFGNVRELSDGHLRCGEEEEWQLVVDYPFDQQGHGPEDDLKRLDQFRDDHPGAEEPSVVWLPTFLSHKGEQALGDYVVLKHVLDPANTARYLSHLQPEFQAQAKADLRSLQNQKRTQLERALSAAYGLSARKEDPLLDPTRRVEDHFRPISAGLQIGGLLAGSMSQGFEQLVHRVLEHRFPHHPRFGGDVTVHKLDRIRQLVERLIERSDKRMAVEAQDRKELQAFSDPLGLTQTTEAATLLHEQTFQDLEQKRLQAGLDAPTAADVRGWADPQGHRGLTAEIGDLVVRLYAEWAGRTLERSGRAYDPGKLGQMPGDVVLVRPDLPSETNWAAGLDRAARLFGISFAGRHLSARNLAAFGQKLTEAAQRHSAAKTLPGALETRLAEWGGAAVGADRLTTARSAARVIAALEGHAGAEQVRQLVAVSLETSETAVTKSLATAAANFAALQSEGRWAAFAAVRQLTADPVKTERAQQLLADLATALETDEVNQALVGALEELTRRASELIGGRTHSGWTTWQTRSFSISGPDGWSDRLLELAEELEQLASDRPHDEVKLDVVATVKVKAGDAQ